MNENVKRDIEHGIYESPVARFRKWMHSRGEPYATLEIKHYMDGGPYFSFLGIEMSLSEFLSREEELTGE